eukprot:scaffold10110_cov69-Phaeocystis_antarctica.AAC.12
MARTICSPSAPSLPREASHSFAICSDGTIAASSRASGDSEKRGQQSRNIGAEVVWMTFRDTLGFSVPFAASVVMNFTHAVARTAKPSDEAASSASGGRASPITAGSNAARERVGGAFRADRADDATRSAGLASEPFIDASPARPPSAPRPFASSTKLMVRLFRVSVALAPGKSSGHAA